MSEYNTPADYAAQTVKWRERFGIGNYLPYGEQVLAARDGIAQLRRDDPAEYEIFMAEALAWGAREEETRGAALAEMGPVAPHSSGHTRDAGDYIALGMSTAAGVIAAALEHAATTGDVVVGHIVSAYSNTRWRYEARLAPYNAWGLSPHAFLARVDRDAPIVHDVSTEYVALSAYTGLAYRKRVTCSIRCELVGTTSVRDTDSPQYADGSPRPLVHDHA